MQWEPWSWLYLVCFLDLFGASMIMPVFSSHLRSLEISHADIGLLSSVYGVTQLVSGPIVGSWSDVNGRRSILCLSMIICSLAYGLMGGVSTFTLFLLIRCIIGFFKHTQSLSRTFVADIVPEEKQAAVHGLINAFTSFSFTIGPVISGHVMELNNGFQLLTSTVMLIFMLNMTVVYIFANEKESRKISAESNFLHKITSVFQELYNIPWKNFWALLSVKFLFALSGMIYFQSNSVILIENYQISPKYMGYTISFYGLVSVLCNLGVEKIKKSGLLPTSKLKSLTYTCLLMCVTFYFLYIVDNFVLFVMGIVPLSSSHALSRIIMTEVLLDQCSASCRGSMVGASGSVASIARILSPFISGLIISWGGVSYALVASSVTAACACLLTLFYTFQITSRPVKVSVD